MACSVVAPALPHQMFLGADGFAKARHRRTGAVVFALEMPYDAAGPGTEADVLRPRPAVVPDSESFSIPLPAEDEAAAKTTKRRWGGEMKRKILASARRANILGIGKQSRAPPEQQATTPRSPHDVDALMEAAGIRRVCFHLPAEETVVAAPPSPPRSPTGVLGEPPERESLARSGPEMTAAFLASVIAAADPCSDTPTDRDELVARWKEEEEACSRRARYLRDCCPFQRDEDDEEREPETTTTKLLPAEPDHA